MKNIVSCVWYKQPFWTFNVEWREISSKFNVVAVDFILSTVVYFLLYHMYNS